MSKYRIKYKNSWNEEKSIIIEGTYWTVHTDAKMMFGEKNIISITDLDSNEVPDKLFAEDDEYYIFDN